MIAGTESPPTDWVNARLKQLGEKWAVQKQPVGVKRWEILPFELGQPIRAGLHYSDVSERRRVAVSYYEGMAPDLTRDYAARSALEESLWERISTKDLKPLDILKGIENYAVVESSVKLTQELIDKLKNGFVYYFMVVITSEDGSTVQSCIFTGKERPPAYSYCVSHND
jgi:hypothetical protein